ncbi:hypothetical protein Q2T42_26420 [Leptolyngbya boryana CZ1]|uniref:Uncharacterized protein n=1 Tax=Leptolyngbya boryana CZ1 TaxID=3060204 RepID=A0AA96WTV5_LEPBY|nr:hypothetical protein [Leptolyngbya boryana]WNZ45328.1 hypothetical protein Q2T42_26420 [Leptolyngbya boryana CZ1]
MRLLLLFALFTCSLTLVLSIYPGLLNGFVVFVAIALLWLILIGWVAISTLQAWRNQSSMRPVIAIALMLAISYGLLKFYVPRRVAFAFSRPAFEQWLAAHPEKLPEGRELNSKLGIYQVEDYFAGDGDDHYFRTYHHGDGLGPDTVSYGFAYQPNLKQSPLGAAGYKLHPLEGKWYWFIASNDW